MIEGLRPYPVARDSGVPWLGEVPDHWEIRRVKSLFRERDQRSGDGTGLLLSLTRARGIVPQAEASDRLASASDLSKYKICASRDLVMNRMQAWSGMFAVSPLHGLVSPDYSVFEPSAPLEVDYFAHLFRTPALVAEFAQRSKGIGSGFNRLYTPDFGAIPVSVPPLSEQAAIVRFLDYVDRRIRHYVRAKQRLIKLLEEQKQAIIHRAVTGGLDPNVRVKPSGVEWLGDVPEHWEVVPLCAIARPRKHTNDGDRELLSVYLGRGVIPFTAVEEKRTNPTSEDLSHYQVVEPGDFVLNNQQAWRGSVGVSQYEGIVSPAYLVLALDERLARTFADRLLSDRAMVAQYLICSKGVGSIQRNLYWPHLRRVATPIPPPAEQAAIVRFLEEATASLGKAIERTGREIDLVREHRTRLIADVVTGKVDVRQEATRLPDETGEPELLDETETESDVEAIDADATGDVPEEAEA